MKRILMAAAMMGLGGGVHAADFGDLGGVKAALVAAQESRNSMDTLMGEAQQHGNAVQVPHPTGVEVHPGQNRDGYSDRDLASMASDTADRVRRADKSLSEGDRRELRDLLRRMDRILELYVADPGAGDGLMCKPVSSIYGTTYSLYDLRNRQAIGDTTSLNTCKQLAAGMKNDLVCKPVSSIYGTTYSLFSLRGRADVGVAIGLTTCQQLIDSSRNGFVCKPVSSIYGSSFSLFDIRRQESIGEAMSLESCTSLMFVRQ